MTDDTTSPGSASAKKRATSPSKRRPRLPARLALIGALLVGVVLGRIACSPSAGPAPAEGSQATAPATVWTCSMHPQIRLPEPGACPICGMDLIPAEASGADGVDPATLSMSANAAALAEIRSQPVERRLVTRDVRMVGMVSFDETRLSYITAWVPSRLDRLFVDSTGITVREGDHLAEVYSPDLIATQQELIQAIETEHRLLDSPVGLVKSRQAASVQSARDRLRLWGLETDQIDEVVARGKPFEHITITSPVTGIVVHKSALQGDYVETGTRIYTIADLTRIWVQLDAYEADLSWLHYGQEVEFTTEAWPGETFHGRISLIDPVLDDRTRTVKVRLNVDNSALRLKPGMFVRATVKAPVTAAGILIDPELADMWMCSMHPEVVSAEPGSCDVCGMDLVPTAELGFLPMETAELPLVIPDTAPLVTGTRAVVYVEVEGAERPTYVGREVTLGPRAGDWYVVEEGLAEGDRVVVNGAFKLDSELQIRAGPSMMSPREDTHPPGHRHEGGGRMSDALDPADVPEVFGSQLETLLEPYLVLQRALADDAPGPASDAAAALAAALAEVAADSLPEAAHEAWLDLEPRFTSSLDRLTAAGDLDASRASFHDLSQALIETIDRFGVMTTGPDVGIFFCPMAFEEGARWIQAGIEVANPYFGSAMRRCGDRERSLGGGL